jgi:hypothetical protein
MVIFIIQLPLQVVEKADRESFFDFYEARMGIRPILESCQKQFF